MTACRLSSGVLSGLGVTKAAAQAHVTAALVDSPAVTPPAAGPPGAPEAPRRSPR
ncbi:hypothetical protein; putative signal peptide [Frankia alni ACN14a]|uniref:Uncharacterized protein n=1 Tax=Frankia alni (strain DSM 45986 / CECT 9034 / ACN14a) TaxID=326424 RepID=Q0RQW8_FRAAA|nr:hypothetical protein; putative signal peptide [Frankia alni ACN14a]